MRKGDSLIGAVPEQHAPSVTRVIQNSHKYAVLQQLKARQGFAGNMETQFNINPTQLRLVQDVTASSSELAYSFGDGQKYESYETGLGTSDAFVITGIALKLGVVATVAEIGNEVLVQNANATTFAGNSGADAKAIQAFLSGTFDLRAAGEETLYGQSASVLDFIDTFANSEGTYRLGNTTFHEVLKTVELSGNEQNIVTVKANGSITSIPANLRGMLVLDGFILRRKKTSITRQA